MKTQVNKSITSPFLPLFFHLSLQALLPFYLQAYLFSLSHSLALIPCFVCFVTQSSSSYSSSCFYFLAVITFLTRVLSFFKLLPLPYFSHLPLCILSISPLPSHPILFLPPFSSYSSSLFRSSFYSSLSLAFVLSLISSYSSSSSFTPYPSSYSPPLIFMVLYLFPLIYTLSHPLF